MNYTPVPKSIHRRNPFKKMVFLSLIPIFIIGVSVLIYFQYKNYLNKLDGSTGAIYVKASPTVTPKVSIPPTASPFNFDIGELAGWQTMSGGEFCPVSMPIPPAEEPYIIPRDPNTKPTIDEDEGRYWIFEEADADIFEFKHMVRAIFKSPDKPTAGYVSAAVEVYCSPNTDSLNSRDFANNLQKSLEENYSIVRVQEIIDDILWGQDVELIRFRGGDFGEEQYALLTTPGYAYLIKNYGETSNPDILNVRNEIFKRVRFQ